MTPRTERVLAAMRRGFEGGGRGVGGVGGAIVVLALLAGVAAGQASRPVGSAPLKGYGAESRPSADAWPEFRGGPWNRGRAFGPAPTFRRIVWTKPCDGRVYQQPAVFGGRVYVGTTDGVVFCRDVEDGREIFRTRAIEPFGGAPATLTYSSPLVAFGRVYFGSEGGTLFAFDAETGAPVFASKLGERIWAAPKTDGRMIVVSTVEGDVHAVEPYGGETLWRAPIGVELGASATILGDVAWIPGYGDRTVVADLLKGTCEVLDLGFSSSATPAAAFGGLYFRDSKGRFSRLDLRARAVDWRKKERGDFDRSCPAVDDERVYFAAHGAVRAFDPSTGERIWEFPLNRMIHTSPVVAGDRVYFGADDGFVRMLDAAKGTELKSFDLGHAIVGSFAIAKGRLFVADGVKGDLHAIE